MMPVDAVGSFWFSALFGGEVFDLFAQKSDSSLAFNRLHSPWNQPIDRQLEQSFPCWIVYKFKLVMFKRLGEHAVRCTCRRPVTRRQIAIRKFSVHHNPDASVASTASPIGGLTTELDRIAPRFEISASNIDILDSPSSFYETLKVGP